MAYRDDLDAAHARIASLEQELAHLRGEAPPPAPARRGIIDDISEGIEQFGRDVSSLWDRATKRSDAAHTDDRARLIATIAPLGAADRGLLEQIAVVLRTERDPARRAGKVRLLVEASAPDDAPPAM